jgi:hypothetical protein
MLLSSQILNAAAAAVSTEMHSMLGANKKQQHSGVDLFDRSISTFRGAVDLQAPVPSNSAVRYVNSFFPPCPIIHAIDPMQNN